MIRDNKHFKSSAFVSKDFQQQQCDFFLSVFNYSYKYSDDIASFLNKQSITSSLPAKSWKMLDSGLMNCIGYMCFSLVVVIYRSTELLIMDNNDSKALDDLLLANQILDNADNYNEIRDFCLLQPDFIILMCKTIIESTKKSAEYGLNPKKIYAYNHFKEKLARWEE